MGGEAAVLPAWRRAALHHGLQAPQALAQLPAHPAHLQTTKKEASSVHCLPHRPIVQAFHLRPVTRRLPAGSFWERPAQILLGCNTAGALSPAHLRPVVRQQVHPLDVVSVHAGGKGAEHVKAVPAQGRNVAAALIALNNKGEWHI